MLHINIFCFNATINLTQIILEYNTEIFIRCRYLLINYCVVNTYPLTYFSNTVKIKPTANIVRTVAVVFTVLQPAN